MLHLAVEPDYEDEAAMRRFRQSMKNWEKKIDRLSDEMLLHIREQINYILEKRSEHYIDEMIKNNKRRK